jgi:phosphogluconate dehydratase
VSPEACCGGHIAAIKDGDLIRLDGHSGELRVLSEDFEQRTLQTPEAETSFGLGRELFQVFRNQVSGADKGAISIDF